MKLVLKPTESLRVLDFDIETRRIGFHNGGRFRPDGCEPIAIACSWVGQSRVYCWTIKTHGLKELLEKFLPFYEEAGMVTGHYVRKFDLPILNGSMMEQGLPLLSPRRVQDTKCDLADVAGLSLSQENLGALHRLEASKFHMNDHAWREVARLAPGAMDLARRRVVGDVIQHKQLRQSLLDAGALNPARVWQPGGIPAAA